MTPEQENKRNKLARAVMDEGELGNGDIDLLREFANALTWSPRSQRFAMALRDVLKLYVEKDQIVGMGDNTRLDVSHHRTAAEEQQS